MQTDNQTNRHHHFIYIDLIFLDNLTNKVLMLCCVLQDQVWGVAYEIPPAEEENVITHLNYRESGGYVQVVITFHPENTAESAFDLTLYLATELSENYLGPASIEDIAKQVMNSSGLSGKNTDYILNLAEALRQVSPHVVDDHLFELEQEVLRLGQQSEHIH